MRITLKNDFHNTSVDLNCKVLHRSDDTGVAYPTPSQLQRSRRKLCGIRDCFCSDDAGTRGRQQLPNGKRLDVHCRPRY